MSPEPPPAHVPEASDVPAGRDAIEAIEIELLLEGVFRRYGYDFRGYAAASMRRRVLAVAAAEKLTTVSALAGRLLHDPDAFERFLIGVTVHTTEMFRDPGFFHALRAKVLPHLRTYAFARIWIAGCSSGEELYSLAILCEEEGLAERCRIYATDLSEVVLARARGGIYPLSVMRAYTKNYQKAGGAREFSEYYHAHEGAARFAERLRVHVVFAPHNLATDGSFNEFQLVLCRNVMIYFKRALQERALKLLDDSLLRLGVLALGRSESLRFTPLEPRYEALDERERIYRRAS
jgi:chemotaxis protein methyltransferase CheR